MWVVDFMQIHRPMQEIDVLSQASGEQSLICFASLSRSYSEWVRHLLHVGIVHEERPSDCMIMLEVEYVLG